MKLVCCETSLHKKMKKSIFLMCLVSVALLLLVSKCDALRQGGICSWTSYESSKCSRREFPCSDGTCIDRLLHCNSISDCEDGSDEELCGTTAALDTNYLQPPESPQPSRPIYHPTRSECPAGGKYIPNEWFCDGIKDCLAGVDEQCEAKVNSHAVNIKSAEWLNMQKKGRPLTSIWGSSVDKSAIALYFANNGWSQKSQETRKDLAYELSIQLLYQLSQKKLKDIPSDNLASFVNAFLVTCLDPRKFHGMDLISELRSRISNQNYTNPYLLLSLCNAGDTITEWDKLKLMDAFRNKRTTFWTDTRALAVMALACANKQTGNGEDAEKLKELVMELKHHQDRSGMVENLQTTALVMQALLSTEPDTDIENFDEEKALEKIFEMQNPDGSFGSFVNTFYVLPVLNCKSLLNISSDHCESSSKKSLTAEDLINLGEPKVKVRYMLRIGNESDFERYLSFKVPTNITFYRVMEIAADLDSRYSFEYVLQDGKPYINAISGLQDDPLTGKFWFLYTVKKGKAHLSDESPVDVIIKGNAHFIMWYRRGKWVD